MRDVSDKQFEAMIAQAYDRLSPQHREAIRNLAIVTAEEPTAEQRRQLHLRGDQTLLGLYSGVPLPARQGRTDHYPPDVITLFKQPLLAASVDVGELRENIRHTLWHEVAHYFGLDHKRIYELEQTE